MIASVNWRIAEAVFWSVAFAVNILPLESLNAGSFLASFNFCLPFFFDFRLVCFVCIVALANRITATYMEQAFTKEKLRFRRHPPGVTFSVHMDNSRCHNGRMAAAEFDCRRLGRAEHPPYAPDLIPCDFWLFGFLKEKFNDRQLRGVQFLHQAITDLWDELTFEGVQAVFL
jgi:hypothetical protein